MEENNNKENKYNKIIFGIFVVFFAIGAVIAYSINMNNKEEKIITNDSNNSVNSNSSTNSNNKNDKTKDTTNKNNDIDNNKTTEDTTKDNDANNISDGISFPIEEGYSEVILDYNQRKEINEKLLVFNVEGGWSLLDYDDGGTKHYHVGDDLFAGDCTKETIAYAYFYNQISGHLDKYVGGPKYPASNFYTEDEEGYHIDGNKIEELAEKFFNKDINCDLDYSGTLKLIAGGGFSNFILKTVKKYKNENNYYLILHLYGNDCYNNITKKCYNNCTDNEDVCNKKQINCFNEERQKCYDLDDDSSKDGRYYKLKYYKDDNKEYMISLELLKQ